MSHSGTYDNKPYMARKNLGQDVYIEIVDIRIKNGRTECLSRFSCIKSYGLVIEGYGYRWRKICGKGLFVPSLNRVAKDDHSLSLSIRNPINGKMNRVYLRDLKKE